MLTISPASNPDVSLCNSLSLSAILTKSVCSVPSLYFVLTAIEVALNCFPEVAVTSSIGFTILPEKKAVAIPPMNGLITTESATIMAPVPLSVLRVFKYPETTI